MEIIQQRLIWLLGTASLLIVLSRLTAHHLNMSRITLSKIRIGLSLLFFGTVAGIIGRLGIVSQAVTQSGLIFYLENIVGCLGGWCLILWGIIEWAGDKTYTSISVSRSRAFTEKLAQTVIEEQSAGPFLSRIAKYLIMAIDCDGLSLHARKGNGGFGLQFEYGFGHDLAKSIANPTPSGPIANAAGLGETVILDTPEEIHAEGLVATVNGPVTKCVSVPLNNGSAVMTVYYSKSHGFGDTDFEILNNTATALASCIRRDSIDRVRERHAREKELQSELSAFFAAESGLYSPLIKSARLLGGHFPFTEISLYISGDGAVQSFDFEIGPDPTLRIKSGYLAKAKYPFLYKSQAAFLNKSDGGARAILSRGSVIASGKSIAGRCFWLAAEYSNSDETNQAPVDLLNTLLDLISRKLSEEDMAEQGIRFGQMFGAMRYLQEKAISGENIAGMMQMAAQAIVETGLYPFCRVTLCGPARSELKTAALAQVRPVTWQLQHLPSIPLDRAPLHRQALTSVTPVSFGPGVSKNEMPQDEICLLLPEGASHGMIIPLVLEGKAVGAVTVGDFRDTVRTESVEPARMFLEDIAGLISMLLTWHKEKRVAGEVREGQRKLTMIRPESAAEKRSAGFSPGVRSRLNGPLAGILASCEYLKESYPDLDRQVGRYLAVIEKNAERIHEITSGLAGK